LFLFLFFSLSESVDIFLRDKSLFEIARLDFYFPPSFNVCLGTLLVVFRFVVPKNSEFPCCSGTTPTQMHKQQTTHPHPHPHQLASRGDVWNTVRTDRPTDQQPTRSLGVFFCFVLFLRRDGTKSPVMFCYVMSCPSYRETDSKHPFVRPNESQLNNDTST